MVDLHDVPAHMLNKLYGLKEITGMHTHFQMQTKIMKAIHHPTV